MFNRKLADELRARSQVAIKSGDGRAGAKAVLDKVEELLRLAETIDTKSNAIRQNVMVPTEGRRKLLQDAVTENVKAIQRVENALAEARRDMASVRANVERLPAPPSDPVSIQIRAELRAQLRAMESQKRHAAVDIGNVSPDMLQAIFEAPAELSGLPAPLVAHLRRSLVVARGTNLDAFDQTESELTALASAALQVARASAGGHSEIEPSAFAARVSSVRDELAATADYSDAPIGQLIDVAKRYAAAGETSAG